jgi:HSP20 family protein
MKPTKLFNQNFPDFFTKFDDFFNTTLPKRWFEMETPPVNIKETENEYVLEIATPGIDKKDININVNNGVLTISSEKKNEIKEEKEGYKRVEYNFSSFSRSFNLPENTLETNISAKQENGQLNITIPKSSASEETKSYSVSIE